MAFTSLIPILQTEQIDNTIRYYVDILSFTCDNYKEAEGWAMLSKDGLHIYLSHPNATNPMSGGPFTGTLYITTDDIDALWASLMYKAEIKYPLSDQQHGMREFGVLDNNGYLIHFGQSISDYQRRAQAKATPPPPKRVESIGGIFFKTKNPALIREWYAEHLGLVVDKYGTSFEYRLSDAPERKGYAVWSPFDETTDYFEPSTKDFMVNFRVQNLVWLIQELKDSGVQIAGEISTYEYGKFAHIMDPEGNKIELWEPNDIEYEKMLAVVTK